MSSVSEITEARQAGRKDAYSEPLDKNEEKRLVEACRKGDTEAFNRLIQVFQNQVFGLAFQMLRNHEEAEDVAQEVFISCYRNIEKFRFAARLGTWLYRVTGNQVKNRGKYHQRRQQAKHESLDETRLDDDRPVKEPSDPAPGPRRRAEAKEMLGILNENLAKLSPEFQEIVALRFNQNLPYEKIAEILDCSMGTVKSRINRARRQLRESMKDLL